MVALKPPKCVSKHMLMWWLMPSCFESPTCVSAPRSAPQAGPWVLWSVELVIVNAINYVLLVPVAADISLLNIIAFVLIRHHLCFFYTLVGLTPLMVHTINIVKSAHPNWAHPYY